VTSNTVIPHSDHNGQVGYSLEPSFLGAPKMSLKKSLETRRSPKKYYTEDNKILSLGSYVSIPLGNGDKTNLGPTVLQHALTMIDE
jgi:hypothetical protein